jgi:hypothetical protein
MLGPGLLGRGLLGPGLLGPGLLGPGLLGRGLLGPGLLGPGLLGPGLLGCRLLDWGRLSRHARGRHLIPGGRVHRVVTAALVRGHVRAGLPFGRVQDPLPPVLHGPDQAAADADARIAPTTASTAMSTGWVTPAATPTWSSAAITPRAMIATEAAVAVNGL